MLAVQLLLLLPAPLNATVHTPPSPSNYWQRSKQETKSDWLMIRESPFLPLSACNNKKNAPVASTVPLFTPECAKVVTSCIGHEPRQKPAMHVAINQYHLLFIEGPLLFSRADQFLELNQPLATLAFQNLLCMSVCSIPSSLEFLQSRSVQDHWNINYGEMIS